MSPSRNRKESSCRASISVLVAEGNLGFAGAGLGEAGLAEVAEFVFFEVGQDFLGAGDDFGGEAGQAGDLDAVGFVGGAGFDAAEEDDAVALFADADVVVLDAGKGEGDVGQFVVVGREEGLGLDGRGVVQVLDDGPGDGNSVEGAGAAADFVEDDQGGGGGVVEDVGGFLHLDHEGGAAADEVVAGADAREDAVDDAHAQGIGGDESTHLGHDDDEGDLPDVGGFAGHVGAGDDHDLVRVAVEERVVGNEARGVGEALDDRMPTAADFQFAAVGDLGAGIAADRKSVV